MTKRYLPPLLAAILFLLLWEGVVHWFAIEKWILPAPSEIVKTFWQDLPMLMDDLIATTWIAGIGLLLGVIIGVIIAVGLHLFPLLERAFSPFLVMTQNIPIIALAPLLVIWFGFGILPKVLIVILVCFFPVTVAALDGFRQTDPTLLRYMKMAGATRWQTFVKLEWPASLPAFFSGCKVAATYSVMGAVISEWLGAQEGLGLRMQTAASAFRTDRVFVTIAIIVILSLMFFWSIQLIENRATRWKQKKGSV